MRKLAIVFLILSSVHIAGGAEEVHIYDSHGKRDPFVPLLGVKMKVIGSLEDIASVEELSLQGIASDSTGKKVAILNGEMVKEGETVGRLTIKKILKNSVILTIDGEKYTLNVYQTETR